MAENKTQPTEEDVLVFLNSVKHQQRREDGFVMLEIMEQLTGSQPVMWGKSIVGFGKYTYKYASGRSGDWFIVGFSPRKASMSVYLMCALEKLQPILKRLGKHKTGKGCLYINRLDDVDLEVFKELIIATIKMYNENDYGHC